MVHGPRNIDIQLIEFNTSHRRIDTRINKKAVQCSTKWSVSPHGVDDRPKSDSDVPDLPELFTRTSNFDKRRGKECLPDTTVRHTVLEAASTDDVMAKGLTGQSSLLHYQRARGTSPMPFGNHRTKCVRLGVSTPRDPPQIWVSQKSLGGSSVKLGWHSVCWCSGTDCDTELTKQAPKQAPLKLPFQNKRRGQRTQLQCAVCLCQAVGKSRRTATLKV
jgi:hypothetical protein